MARWPLMTSTRNIRSANTYDCNGENANRRPAKWNQRESKKKKEENYDQMLKTIFVSMSQAQACADVFSVENIFFSFIFVCRLLSAVWWKRMEKNFRIDFFFHFFILSVKFSGFNELCALAFEEKQSKLLIGKFHLNGFFFLAFATKLNSKSSERSNESAHECCDEVEWRTSHNPRESLLIFFGYRFRCQRCQTSQYTIK